MSVPQLCLATSSSPVFAKVALSHLELALANVHAQAELLEGKDRSFLREKAAQLATLAARDNGALPRGESKLAKPLTPKAETQGEEVLDVDTSKFLLSESAIDIDFGSIPGGDSAPQGDCVAQGPESMCPRGNDEGKSYSEND